MRLLNFSTADAVLYIAKFFSLVLSVEYFFFSCYFFFGLLYSLLLLDREPATNELLFSTSDEGAEYTLNDFKQAKIKQNKKNRIADDHQF